MKRGARWVGSGVAALALLLGACGNADDATPQEIVFASAAETSDAGSSKVALTIDMGEAAAAQGMPSTIEAEGAFDYDAMTGTMTMSMPIEAGEPPVDIEVRMIDRVMYMRFPAQMAAVFGGKPWMKIDLEAAAGEAGVDFGSLTSTANADPTQSLAQLRGVSDDVTEVGEEEVRGVATTHYRATVDVEKAIAETPEEQRGALRKALEQYGTDTIPMDVWIDDEGRVRRLTHELEIANAGTVNMTVELFDFGTEVSVEAPPEEDVADLMAMMSQLSDDAADKAAAAQD